MPIKNPNRDLFDFMRGLGKFQEYEDYDDYRRKVYGIGEEYSENFREFYDALGEEEKEQFNYVFN